MPHKTKEGHKAWRERSKDKIMGYRKSHRARHPDTHREVSFKYHYGITLEDYDRILKNQGGVCAICKGPETHKNKRYLSVDHDHNTGKIRGLLCSDHNTMLSRAQDSILILQSAIRYLTPIREEC